MAQGVPQAVKLVARTRPLPVRKQVLYEHHRALLTSSPLVLFLRPGDFSAHEWRSIRAQLAQVPPPPPSPSSSTPSSSSSPPAPTDAGLTLTLLRPGLLPALLRDPASPLSASLDTTFLASPSHLAGPLAVLTAPSLHPPTLARALALVQSVSRTPKADAPPPAAGAPPLERLGVLSALVERAAADPARTDAVAKLPPLEVLRAQLVGLISAPGSRIAGVLGARAQEVGRTLEGFKLGLEEQQQGAKGAEA
ncbi:hypothetical protein JCM10450v2_007559 [Rhodotorula kratochvilovae]